MTFQEKRTMMIENARNQKQLAINEMEKSINQLIITTGVFGNFGTSISLVTKTEKSIVDYSLYVYPNCYKLTVNYRKPVYPFDYYNQKDYYEVSQAPKAHQASLQKLVDALNVSRETIWPYNSGLRS